MPRSPLFSLLLAACAASSDDAGRRLARSARAELEALGPGVTLAAWHRDHPDDRLLVDTARSVPELEPHWCAVASSSPADSSRTAPERQAYFALPLPPSAPALPDSASVDSLPGGDCPLALVLVSWPAGDSAAAASAAGELHDSLLLSGRAGGFEDPPVTTPYPWVQPLYARRDSVHLVTAVMPVPGEGARAVAAAWLPIAAASRRMEGSAWEAGLEFWRAYWAREAAIALRETGIDPARRDAMLALLDESEAWGRIRRAADREPEPLPRARLLAAFGAWLPAVRDLPSDQRAAGLFGADIVLEQSMAGFGLNRIEDTTAVTRLDSLGARFSFVPGRDELGYTHSLFAEARASDSLRALAERTTLRQLASGFDLEATCAAGEFAFDEVIRAGDSLLVEHPDGPRAALVHLLLAEAWRDVVALATGIARDRDPPPELVERASSARWAAADHFRSAVARGDVNDLARAFWPEAFRLAVGLRPRQASFWCIPDRPGRLPGNH